MTLSDEMRAPTQASPALLHATDPQPDHTQARGEEESRHKWDINDNTLPIVSIYIYMYTCTYIIQLYAWSFFLVTTSNAKACCFLHNCLAKIVSVPASFWM